MKFNESTQEKIVEFFRLLEYGSFKLLPEKICKLNMDQTFAHNFLAKAMAFSTIAKIYKNYLKFQIPLPIL